jgi:hypothetical protein
MAMATIKDAQRSNHQPKGRWLRHRLASINTLLFPLRLHHLHHRRHYSHYFQRPPRQPFFLVSTNILAPPSPRNSAISSPSPSTFASPSKAAENPHFDNLSDLPCFAVVMLSFFSLSFFSLGRLFPSLLRPTHKKTKISSPRFHSIRASLMMCCAILKPHRTQNTVPTYLLDPKDYMTRNAPSKMESIKGDIESIQRNPRRASRLKENTNHTKHETGDETADQVRSGQTSNFPSP